jgi:hypothetical protein
MGKENLKPDVLKAVHYDNQYVFWLAELVWVCLDLGVPVALSHPAHSILWKILPFRKLRDDGPGMIIFETDVCSLEGGCRRWRLLTNVPGLRGLGNLCTCPDRGPPSQDSSFALEKQAKEYAELVNSALTKGNLSLGIRLEVQRPPKAVSLRAGRNWEPLERWRLVFKGAWGTKEGIATSELRCFALLGRHLGRTRATWNHRYLLLCDSMAAGGAAGKGRSSVFSMLMVCRQLLVIRVAWGIQFLSRWIPSFYNNSDFPSRGGPVGVHPDTKRAHLDQQLPDADLG